MIKSDVALKIVLKNIKPLGATNVVLDKSLGYVLSKNILTPIDLPPFDNSAMDGYAIAKGENSTNLRVTGEVAAGGIYNRRLVKGEAVKIMTGAMVPENTGRVVMKEHVICEDTSINIIKDDNRNNIRRKGECIKRGSKLFAKGQLINSLVLANIASVGINKINVFKKPRASLLVTGSELLNVGDKYKSGKIYNSNVHLLRSLLFDFGITNLDEKKIEDNYSKLKRSVLKQIERSDVMFITGGVSVGDYDYIGRILTDIGCKIYFDKIAVQPGKPFTFAVYKNKPIFAFPGNPVSVFVSFFLFALPALHKMCGSRFIHSVRRIKFYGTFSRRKGNRKLYLPARYTSDNRIEAIKYSGSGDLYSLSKADALLILPEGKTSLRNGEEVDVLPVSF